MCPRCNFYILSLLAFSFCPITFSLPDQGKWTFNINQVSDGFIGVPKSLYKGSTVSISVTCTPSTTKDDTDIKIGWVLRQTPCYEEYLAPQLPEAYKIYYTCPTTAFESSYNAVRFLKSNLSLEKCTHTIDLKVPTTEFEVHTATSIQQCTQNRILEDYVPQKRKLNSASDKTGKAEPIETLPEPEAEKSEKKDGTKRPETDAVGTAEKAKEVKSVGKEKAPSVEATTVKKEESVELHQPITSQDTDHLVTVDQDGVYLLVIYITATGAEEGNFTAILDISLKGPHGYLSAVDWPLLPFYGVMCGIYVIFAVAWLTVSALQWRDLLRIQFWIGGVIFLGLVEKAVFYAEYQYINSTGQSGHGGMLFAEVLSCFKRTLARLLVIIVSLGFGIVKPRLGPALHRVIGVGALYFILCSVEGWLRVLKPKNDPSNQTLMAEIPLAVLDSGICWWIFSSLVQTTRTLRLRRNVVKLGLYRHFTNTLIFSVLASVVYMSWSLYNHKLTSCITDWKELWVDEAYWHLLFSLLLMVIMILWRPTNNNQRYAFTPLLDALDEEEDLLEKESSAMNDIYGTKARGGKIQSSSNKKEQKNGTQQDEDLKWVEENIPSSLSDTALPSLLDSDEEIMTVRFERNKME